MMPNAPSNAPNALSAANAAAKPIPSQEDIELLPFFERLDLDQIVLVRSAEQASLAQAELMEVDAWGFDTESKPTFVKDQKSDGPHTLQLSTLAKAWVFQLHDAGCRSVAAELLIAPGIRKLGFGLGDDRRRILAKLGVEPIDVVELNTEFRKLGYRKDMGVKAAVAVVLQRRFIKSKKVSTSNWANPELTTAQLIYAANDAYAASCVWAALHSD